MWWADRWHWPPTVVDEQPVSRLDRLRVAAEHVEAGRAKADDEERRAQERAQRGQRRG